MGSSHVAARRWCQGDLLRDTVCGGSLEEDLLRGTSRGRIMCFERLCLKWVTNAEKDFVFDLKGPLVRFSGIWWLRQQIANCKKKNIYIFILRSVQQLIFHYTRTHIYIYQTTIYGITLSNHNIQRILHLDTTVHALTILLLGEWRQCKYEELQGTAAKAPLCCLCHPACSHAHFGFASVPAFPSSFQIAAPWNGICGPSGFPTGFHTPSCQMNSSITSTTVTFFFLSFFKGSSDARA